MEAPAPTCMCASSCHTITQFDPLWFGIELRLLEPVQEGFVAQLQARFIPGGCTDLTHNIDVLHEETMKGSAGGAVTEEAAVIGGIGMVTGLDSTT